MLSLAYQSYIQALGLMNCSSSRGEAGGKGTGIPNGLDSTNDSLLPYSFPLLLLLLKIQI